MSISIDPRKTYRLRGNPAAGAGPVYAIFEGNNQPVRVLPLMPPLIERASWRFLPIEGQPDRYRIMYANPGPGIPAVWDVPEHPEPEAPVFTRPDLGQKGWVLKPVTTAPPTPNAYTISPEVITVGVDWLVGTNHMNEAAFQDFLPDDPTKPRPVWTIEPVILDD